MIDTELHMMTKSRVVQGHNCNMDERHQEKVAKFIGSGYFIGCRRRLWTYFIVDGADPQSKAYLRSTSRIEVEKERHLMKYDCTIHPFSRARYHWETLMIVVLLIQLIVIPFEEILPIYPKVMLQVDLVCRIVSLVDVVMFFFTGYYDQRKQKIVLELGKVAKHYVMGHFIFDFLSAIPINYIMQRYDLMVENDTITPMAKMKALSFFKLNRIFTLNDYLKRFYDRMGLRGFYLKVINFFIMIIITILWSCAFKTFILIFRRNSSVTKMYERFNDVAGYLVLRFDRLMREMMLVGYERGDKVTASDDVIMVCHCIFVYLGFVFHLILMVHMVKMFTMKSSSESKYSRLMRQIAEYMNYRELPPELREKILIYINFKFQKHMYKESEIMSTVSEALRQDILLHKCQTLIEKVDFFKDLPENVIQRIIVKLRTEIYLKNDVIFTDGSMGTSMYFIYLGTVAIYAPNGHEICHLTEGDHFGEIALFINSRRTASVVAVTECELYKLSRKDLLEALAPYPDATKNIKTLALERLRQTMRVGGLLD